MRDLEYPIHKDEHFIPKQKKRTDTIDTLFKAIKAKYD